jgi:hypothetical protein
MMLDTVLERKTVTRKLKKRSVDEWSIVIAQAWQQSVVAVFEAGNLLLTARNQLLPSEFKLMCSQKLPFSYGTAIKLMRISSNPILADKSHVKQLPASWGTLYELATLPAPDLERALSSGLVTPRTERKEIEALKPRTDPADEAPPTVPVEVEDEEEERATADAEEDRCVQWVLDLDKKRQLELICNILARCYEKLDDTTKVLWRSRIVNSLIAA